MGSSVELFQLTYNQNDDIVIGMVQCAKVERQEADMIYNQFLEKIKEYPDYRDFVLDVRKVESVSDPAIGVLMKALNLMKKGNNYAILLMTESLLHDIMLRHPEMFDFYAVFHTMEEVIAYVKKRRGEA